MFFPLNNPQLVGFYRKNEQNQQNRCFHGLSTKSTTKLPKSNYGRGKLKYHSTLSNENINREEKHETGERDNRCEFLLCRTALMPTSTRTWYQFNFNKYIYLFVYYNNEIP